LLATGKTVYAGTNNRYLGYVDSVVVADTLHHTVDTLDTLRFFGKIFPEEHFRALLEHDGYLFAALDSGLLRCTIGDTNWTRINTRLPIQRISCFASMGSAIYAGTDFAGVFVSTNNGTTWSQCAYFYGITNICALAVNDKAVFAGTWPNGVYRSLDSGKKWEMANSGFNEANVNSIFLFNRFIFAATYGNGIFISTDNGKKWTARNSGLTDLCITSLGSNGSVLFAGSPIKGMYLSVDTGASWHSINSGLANTMVTSIATGNSEVFAGTCDGVFRSIDTGRTWTELDAGFPTDKGKSVTSLIAREGCLFASTIHGFFYTCGDPPVWTLSNSGLQQTYLTTISLLDSVFYTGDNEGAIYRSTNRGATWICDGTVTRPYATTNAFIKAGHTVFAATTGGIFRFSGDGPKWINVLDTISARPFMTLNYNDSLLFAGCATGGVWYRPLAEMTDAVDATSRQHSGNETRQPIMGIAYTDQGEPFISVIVRAEATVAIKIFDPKGRIVSSVAEKRLQSGSYSFPCDIRNPANGCYIAQVITGNKPVALPFRLHR
jgi:photosystem II stability/assembly factor-like uncharacterized protein